MMVVAQMLLVYVLEMAEFRGRISVEPIMFQWWLIVVAQMPRLRMVRSMDHVSIGTVLF